MYIYYEIVFEKRERDGEGRLGELERVGAGLHHYTLHEGRMGFACFPPCVRDWFSVSPTSPKICRVSPCRGKRGGGGGGGVCAPLGYGMTDFQSCPTPLGTV
jgi:hypothetical protein